MYTEMIPTSDSIGVIVPVYKTEKYIAECIESILAQTYTNFRLILVDDGTPDAAGAICDEYAAKDPRITVIHQDNAGVTRARARGVEEAADCEWITFVDSDDTITSDALETLTSAADKYVEIVVNPIDNFAKTNNINGYIDIERYVYKVITEELCSPVGKLFRKHLFNSKVFDIPRTIYIGEDLIMNLNIAFNTKKNDITITCDKVLYIYNNNPNSTINTFKPTLEYETLLFNKIAQIVSQKTNNENTYLQALIKRRLLWWDRLFGYSCKKPLWSGSEYHKTLLNDIKAHNYPINAIEYLLLKTNNSLARFILINLRKIKNVLTRIASRNN